MRQRPSSRFLCCERRALPSPISVVLQEFVRLRPRPYRRKGSQQGWRKSPRSTSTPVPRSFRVAHSVPGLRNQLWGPWAVGAWSRSPREGQGAADAWETEMSRLRAGVIPSAPPLPGVGAVEAQAPRPGRTYVPVPRPPARLLCVAMKRLSINPVWTVELEHKGCLLSGYRFKSRHCPAASDYKFFPFPGLGPLARGSGGQGGALGCPLKCESPPPPPPLAAVRACPGAPGHAKCAETRAIAG